MASPGRGRGVVVEATRSVGFFRWSLIAQFVAAGQRGPCPARLRAEEADREGDVDSCGDRGGRGACGWQRQAQQGGEAAGAEPDVATSELEELLFVRWPLPSQRSRRHAEQLARGGELGGGGVETDVADLVEALGQHVLHEAPEERDGGEGLDAAAAGAEDDVLGGNVDEAAIGDADAMGVAAEVGDDVPGFLEGLLGVDVPRELADPGDEAPEGGRVGEELDVCEVAGGVSLAEDVQDLAAEQLAHDLDGEEEVAAKATEAKPIERQAAWGDDRVHVGVEAKVAGPGMQDERGAEDRAEPALAELEQGLGGSMKERVEDHLRSAASERPQFRRKREDDVEVPDIEQPLAALLDPMLLGERLTLRAVPVAARMVRMVLVPARRAVLDMASERRCAALLDVRQHPLLLTRQRVQDFEPRAVRAHDVADVELRSPGLRRASTHRRTRPRDGSRSTGLGTFCTSAVETRV